MVCLRNIKKASAAGVIAGILLTRRQKETHLRKRKKVVCPQSNGRKGTVI